MEFELPKINVSFEYDEEKDEIVFVINGVEKRVKTEDMITEMEKLQEQDTALEQEPCEDCQRIYKPNPYYDCISRQNAIDAMWEELDEDTAHKVRDILETQPSVMPSQKPCEDCISREYILSKAHCCCDDLADDEPCCVDADDIKEAPSVQPKPKIGHWIISPNDCFVSCSECGLHGDKGIYKHYRWCPNCGAKMESEDKK